MFSLKKMEVKNKTVFLRVDYNVPLEKGKVIDNQRIKATIPTLKYLLEQNCKIIIGTHLGRPEGKIVEQWRVDPLAKEVQALLPAQQIIKLDDCVGVQERIHKGKAKDMFMLENLRFYAEEEKNSAVFAHGLADLAEVYVNDAFAVCHRKHASVEAITHFLPAVPGLLLEQEITQLRRALEPLAPAVWIMGGAKLDKVDLIKQALQKADYILVGGALAFSFLRAQGYTVGMSKIDAESVAKAKEILALKRAEKIILPVDVVVVEEFSQKAASSVVPVREMKTIHMGLDIGPGTIRLFEEYLRKAHTIVWNGPLGYYEWAQFAEGTRQIARYIGKLTAVSICGGGETAEAVQKFKIDHLFTHVSTGGGAALEFLAGKKLPALRALEDNYLQFKKKV